MEKPKIQIFCQGKKFQFSNKISQKSYFRNHVSEFNNFFSISLKLMQLLGSINKKYILAQTPAETTKHYSTNTKY
jgi:hypothetical protein